MIKVIKEPQKYVIRCFTCDSHLEFDRTDIQSTVEYNNDGPKELKFIKCPRCFQPVILRADLVDYKVEETCIDTGDDIINEKEI